MAGGSVNDFGTWIRENRKRLGLSQTDLALKVGSNQVYVSQWETGKRSPSPAELRSLEALFGAAASPWAGANSGASALPLLDRASAGSAPPHRHLVGTQGTLPLNAPASRASQTTTPEAAPVAGLASPAEGGAQPISAEEFQALSAGTRRGRKPRSAGEAEGNGKNSGNGKEGKGNQGHLGFEEKLWQAADLLRNNMDPAEYKHVVLGLLFLKYIEDAFEERRQALADAVGNPDSEYYIADPAKRVQDLEGLLEDRDEYTAENVFWVPQAARWSHIRAQAKLPSIGRILDDAMDAIERENDRLLGVLPKIYAMPNLDKESLGKLIDLISSIGLGTAEHRDKDTLGRVYEYFLSKFASAEGKGGGEFYTPTSIVRLLVEMLQPYKGRVLDPACGSGGMFVQSLKFILAHDGKRDQITVYGQESNYTTWRMARMNLAIRGIEANLGKKHADSFHDDQHPDLKADYILANPPFNISEWGGEKLEYDVRWKYGRPPTGNANFGWVQHFIHHLAPSGTAGFVLANGSMSSMQSGEGEIRRRIVEADLVDCIVACPGQLFYQTQIPVCLWFLTRSKAERHPERAVGESKGSAVRNRSGQTLFIDARKLGRMETRVHKVLDDADIERIAGTYHAWRSNGGDYKDIPGFCFSAGLEDISKHDFVLTPGRYVGAEEVEDDGEAFDSKMRRLVGELRQQMKQADDLDRRIELALKGLGYGE